MGLSEKAAKIASTLTTRKGNDCNILHNNVNTNVVEYLHDMEEYKEAHYRTRENIDNYIYDKFGI